MAPEFIEQGHQGRARITLDAPVVPLEYPADGEPIYPCSECLPWHVEVITDRPDDAVVVREWHAIGCASVRRWAEP